MGRKFISDVQYVQVTPDLFRTREQMEQSGWHLEGNVFVKEDERYLPLYEAKLFHQYDHRFATFEDADERALSAGNAHNMTADEKADPDSVVIPRYWVPEEEVSRRLVGPRASDHMFTPPHPDQTFCLLAELARNSLSGMSPTPPTSAP